MLLMWKRRPSERDLRGAGANQACSLSCPLSRPCVPPPTSQQERAAMSTIAEVDVRVVAGVDTHKEFHVVVVLDELGRKLDMATFAATPRGYRELPGWVTVFAEALAIGVEGTAT